MSGKKRGFTLTELMAVLTILLLLTSFALPVVWREIRRAQDVAAVTTLRNLQSLHRLASGALLADGYEIGPAQGQVVYIPGRPGSAQSRYAAFLEETIRDAFAEEPPVYEITERRDAAGTQTEFVYWPKPEEKPEICYILRDNTLYYAHRPQPGAQP